MTKVKSRGEPPDLHNHSTFSFIDGMGTPQAAVQQAKALGWKHAAITEHGHLCSAPAFYKACRAEKINPIIGCELYIVPTFDLNEKELKSETNTHLTVLALSKEGYHNLVAWVTWAMRRENFFRKPRISIDKMAEVAPYPLHHNVVLSGCLGSELCRSFFIDLFAYEEQMNRASVYIDGMKSIFPHFYLEMQHHEKAKFFDVGFDEYERMCLRESIVRSGIFELALRTNTPTVITNDSHFQTASQRKAHLSMKASGWRSRKDDATDNKSAEFLVSNYLKDYVYFSSYMQNMEKVADGVDLGSQSLQNVLAIAEEADIRLDPLDNFSYSLPTSGFDDPIREIRKRSKEKLEELVVKHGKEARERFERELSAMGDFAHYLLLMSTFIRYANNQGIFTNTRGSSANSILCYCLDIHQIDSIHYGLRFERFVNPKRKKFPDIDIDIETERFEDFMRFVQEHMAELEGEGQVKPICNFGTLANRSAFKVVADSLGIPKETQEEISLLLPTMIDEGMVEEENASFDLIEAEYPEVYGLMQGVFDSIRQISQHACGWLFGTKDRPIEDWVPLYLIASSGKMVTQFNMKMLEDFGLIKGDFIRLKTLDIVKQTLRLTGRGVTDIIKIPLDDPETFQMLREGRTQGVFSLQGKTQRQGCMEMEVNSINDVIACQALYRPAATRSGLTKLYNKRRKGKEEVSYSNPIAEEILSPTYGVPIFQEQAMELGYAVGMDDLEVEEILAAIKKAKGAGRGAEEAFEKVRPTFLKYAINHMSIEAAESLWEEIANLAGYSFNFGHAASYGELAVRSAYLKCHSSLEFFSSILNAYPDNTEYIAAAKSEGFVLEPPCVNNSGYGFSPGSKPNSIRIGLGRIHGLGVETIRAIIANQPYHSLEDLQEKIPKRILNSARLHALEIAGALSDLSIKGTSDDFEQFKALKHMTVKKPKIFSGIRPKHVKRYISDNGWTNEGLYSGVAMTEGPTSISKLFWIPPLEKKQLYKKKASVWASVKTNLLTVVDENGIPFEIKASDAKPEKARILDFLATRCRGTVICVNGQIRKPFLYKGPLTFNFFYIVGAYNEDAQIWHTKKDDYKRAIEFLHKDAKRAARQP